MKAMYSRWLARVHYRRRLDWLLSGAIRLVVVVCVFVCMLFGHSLERAICPAAQSSVLVASNGEFVRMYLLSAARRSAQRLHDLGL